VILFIVDLLGLQKIVAQMDQRFEIAAFDRHDLKMAWEFVRAVVKIKPQA